VDYLLTQAAGIANANQALMDGTTGQIQRILAEGDLVFGIWSDDSKPHGVDYLILKGVSLLHEIAAGKDSANIKLDAIACDCFEQAQAVKQALAPKLI
jgi:hypothetical protein